jgi:hypothetical protein
MGAQQSCVNCAPSKISAVIRQGLLDAFQDRGLLSHPNARPGSSRQPGPFPKGCLLQALSRIDTALSDRVMAVLEKLGGFA